MTSQSSTNNKSGISFLSLLREDSRHKLWMLALSVLGSLSAGPLAFLFVFTNGYSFNQNRYYVIIGDNVFKKSDGSFYMTKVKYYQELLQNCTQYLNGIYMAFMCFVAFMGAIIVACYGFQFLYKKRMVDLYHSAPLSRTKLFFVNWTDGFLIWLVPAFVCNLITFVMACFFVNGTHIATLFATILISILRQCLVFLIVYNTFLVAVMLSGNIINATINGLTYGLLVFGVVAMILLLMAGFRGSFYMPTQAYVMHPLYVLSPLTTPVLLMIQWYSGEYPFAVWGIQLIGGIVIMIANLFLAHFLYLKRPSELAERGLECKPVRIVFRGTLSLLSGVLFAAAFMEVTNRHNFAWIIFGAFFGSALAFAVLNVIYHVNFKELLSHKLQYVIVFAGCLILFFGSMFDIIGFEKRLPKKENIKGLQLCVSNLTDYSFHLANNNIFDYDAPSDQYISRDQDSIYKFLEACVKKDREPGSYFRITVKVQTTFGSYYRKYSLSYRDLELLAPFVETKEYKEVYYLLPSGKLGLPHHIVLSGYMNQQKVISEQEKLEELMQAFTEDFHDHSTIPELMKRSQRFVLRFWYNIDDAYNPLISSSERSAEYSIPYSYTRTIALIDKWYPDMVWDPTPADTIALDYSVDFYLPEGMSAHDALYEYFGYDPSGHPLQAPAMHDNNLEAVGYITCDFSSENVEFLKEIEPYLIWGTYSNGLDYEYVLLGRALLKEGPFANGGAANCYVRYGTLPLSVLKEIEKNMTVHNYDSNEYGEYYYYD